MDESISEKVKNQLVESSKLLFGEKAQLCIVDPKAVIPLKKNARYMSKPMFDQLSENIKDDGFLSSVPLCQELKNGRFEVLSGNHRVQAAIRAGLERILIIVIPPQSHSHKVAIQLSHNALEGEDDSDLLADIWSGIIDWDDKLYSGLDSEFFEELDPVEFQAFSSSRPETRRIVLWFLSEEVETLDALLREADAAAVSDDFYLVPAQKFDELFNALISIKKLHNIKNTATAFMWLMNQLKEKAVFEGLDQNSE